jgi:hypothetical protein
MLNSLLKENDSHLQAGMAESRHPDFEGKYQEELTHNLDSTLKERYPQLES